MITARTSGARARRRDRQGLAWHLRQPFVPAAKWASAPLRPGHRRIGRLRPDFLVIGAKRGGSTSLYRNLVRTPGVLPLFPRAPIKGTYYFDVEYDRGERWYRSHFASAAYRRPGRRPGTGRHRRGLALLPGAPAGPRPGPPRSSPRPASWPLLRDPVARAHSHYQERVRKQGIEDLPTFAAAVDAEPRRLEGEVERMLEDPGYVSWNHLNFGYLAQSDYATGLTRWRSGYPAEQVLVLRSEDLYADDATVLAQVRGFLGLEAQQPVETRSWNRTGSHDLDPGLARELAARLAPSVEALEALLGWPVGTWTGVAASS